LTAFFGNCAKTLAAPERRGDGQSLLSKRKEKRPLKISRFPQKIDILESF